MKKAKAICLLRIVSEQKLGRSIKRFQETKSSKDGLAMDAPSESQSNGFLADLCNLAMR